MSESNTQYRNSLFCAYFNEPIRLLSLCNAILGTNYDNPAELEITTLEGIFFDAHKNDISCKIGNNILVLIEHQSSVNLNMPFRFFSYLNELFNKLVQNKRQVYRKKRIKFPSPKFFVLYDGDEDEPLERVMRLSESFDDKNFWTDLMVISFNINFALKSPLLEKCPYLNGYSKLVGTVKEGIAQGLSRRQSIIRAVQICINNGVMADYLEEHSREVFNMLTMEWDINEARQAWREDGVDEGIEKGIKKGIEKGIEKGMVKVATKLLRRGMDFSDIQLITDLPMAQIEEISAQIKNNA